MTHGSKIVNLSWSNIRDNSDKIGGVTQVTVMKEKLYSSLVSILVNMINTASVERGRTTNNSMYLFLAMNIL